MGNPTMPGGPIPDPRPAEQRWRDELLRKVREVLALSPDLSHASITTATPALQVVTAYAKREGPGNISAWIRETGGVEPAATERSPYARPAKDRP
jgi:hypothetical protein